MAVTLFIYIFLFAVMISIVSLNVCGLWDIKFKNIILNVPAADVICFQETFWDDDIVNVIRSEWDGNVYFSNDVTCRSGVATLVRRGFCDRVMFLEKDIEGRSLTVQIKLDREHFLKGLWGHLTSDNRIVVGDFNDMLSRIDLAQGMVYKADTSRKSLVHLMDEFHYVDFWRCRHGAKRDFSRRQMVGEVLKQSRIDFGLCMLILLPIEEGFFRSTIHLVIMLHFTFKFTLRN